MWFVCYYGNTNIDPLDKGVNQFDCILKADEFAKRMRNKGYACTIYQGIHYKDVV